MANAWMEELKKLRCFCKKHQLPPHELGERSLAEKIINFDCGAAARSVGEDGWTYGPPILTNKEAGRFRRRGEKFRTALNERFGWEVSKFLFRHFKEEEIRRRILWSNDQRDLEKRRACRQARLIQRGEFA
jgi:hypothetical protein